MIELALALESDGHVFNQAIDLDSIALSVIIHLLGK